MELADGRFHHGQFHAVESLVLELGEEGIERNNAIVSNESSIVDACQRWAADL